MAPTQTRLAADRSRFSRIAILTYGITCYTMFLGVFLYAVGFIGDFGVPRTIDGAPRTGLGMALAINAALLGLFAVQHSGMARPAFKRWLCRFIPRPVERSTYVLASNLAMIALFALWQPFGGSIWQVTSTGGQAAIYTLYALGWLTVLVSTFLIDHFDLFGLRQTFRAFLGKEYTPPKFVMPLPYKFVRHPLYVGWLMVIWSTPSMTLPHLFFAVMVTGYIFVGIFLEERDLSNAHPEYVEYRRRVPMIVPRIGRRRAVAPSPASAAGLTNAEEPTAKPQPVRVAS